MKNFIVGLFVVVALAVGAIAYAATTAGVPSTTGGAKIMGTVPEKSKSACVDLVKGRATASTVDVSGTSFMNWVIVDPNTGVAQPGKRYIGSNTVAFPALGEKDVPVNANAKTFKFERYTGGATVKLCTERM